jgi:hypothetical protein
MTRLKWLDSFPPYRAWVSTCAPPAHLHQGLAFHHVEWSSKQIKQMGCHESLARYTQPVQLAPLHHPTPRMSRHLAPLPTTAPLDQSRWCDQLQLFGEVVFSLSNKRADDRVRFALSDINVDPLQRVQPCARALARRSARCAWVQISCRCCTTVAPERVSCSLRIHNFSFGGMHVATTAILHSTRVPIYFINYIYFK